MLLDVETRSVRVQSGGFESDLICLRSGSKVQIREVKTRIGGGGVNTSVDLSRLRNNVRFLGKVGGDNNSRKILRALKKEGVEAISSKPSEVDGGFSIIIKSADGDRTILTYKGANDNLRWDDFSKSLLRGVDWFYFASMTGESYNTGEKLKAWAVEHDVKVLFNPSSYVVRRGFNYIRKMMSASDILIVNMEEAQTTLGLQPNAAQLPEGEVDSILLGLHRRGPKIVAVTNGEKRVYVFDGKYKYSALPYPVKVMDVAGAGDAFGSGFMSAYMMEENVEQALKAGLACAYSVVGSPETWIQLRGMKGVEAISREFEMRNHRVTKQQLL
jgi:sugar/nucleoside kinase (ribokinase family)